MDLILSIDLPKVEDIAHVPPPFPDCDNWAAPHSLNQIATNMCITLPVGTWKKQPWTHDRTEHQHK